MEGANRNVIAAFLALEGAHEARSAPETAEKAILEALALAPDDVEVRLGAYRFYFYNHYLAEALPHSEFIIAYAARRLNIAVDWRAVRPDDTLFEDLEAVPGLYLQALIAWGYCKVRLGAQEEGCMALSKVVALDPRDRFGAGLILATVTKEADEGT